MRPVRAQGIAVLVLLGAAPAAIAAPPELWAGSSQRLVKASTDDRLQIRRGHRLAFYFSRPVDTVEVGAGIAPEGEAGDRIWMATVPRRLTSGLRRVRVAVTAPSGDREFSVRLEVLRSLSGRARVPRLTGRPSTVAVRMLERRGLCWRFGHRGDRTCDSGPPPPPWFRRPGDEGVTEQSPRPRTRVRRGTTIRLMTHCTSLTNGEHCD